LTYGNGCWRRQRRIEGRHQRDAARRRHAGAADHHDARRADVAEGRRRQENQEQTVVHITADSRFFVNGVPVDRRDFADRVANVLEEKKERIVLIKGDEDAPYASIMLAMDDLRKANIENVGLITERKLRPGEVGGK
jgi:biopolymer transport protein ExbD